MNSTLADTVRRFLDTTDMPVGDLAELANVSPAAVFDALEGRLTSLEERTRIVSEMEFVLAENGL